MFSCGFCEIYKNIFFTEFLWVTDSLLFFLYPYLYPKHMPNLVMIHEKTKFGDDP